MVGPHLQRLLELALRLLQLLDLVHRNAIVHQHVGLRATQPALVNISKPQVWVRVRIMGLIIIRAD
eukprot:COSAG01_NODE_254_length_20214_cov_25.086254_9_plen_66_part_00